MMKKVIHSLQEYALNLFALFNFILVFLVTSPLLVYFGLFNLVGFITKAKRMKHYSLRVIVGLDQTWNSALRGEEDETVSSRLGRAVRSGRPKLGALMFAMFVNALFRVIAGEKNHVIDAIEERYLEHGAPSDEKWSFIVPLTKIS